MASRSTTVRSEAAIEAVLAGIGRRLGDWRGFWRRMERDTGLPSVQRSWWDDRFNRGLQHAPGTVAARAKRKGYYRNAPSNRASPSSPYLEWTGSLRKATDHFTRRTALEASIDADRNYRGPLRRVFSNPVTAVLSPHNVDAWEPKRVERLIDQTMDEWLVEDVLP